jgi:hypothetical protein
MSILHRFQDGYTWDGKNEDYHKKKLATCPPSGQHMDRSMIQASQWVDENAKILYTLQCHLEGVRRVMVFSLGYLPVRKSIGAPAQFSLALGLPLPFFVVLFLESLGH